MHVGLASGFAHQRGDGYDDARLVREEVDNLVYAEELGFDSVWITEHHFSDYSVSNDPIQLLTWIAARTKRVKLGTQCIIVPWHNPTRLAEYIINLDILSGGRAVLGFGGGLAPQEFAGMGIDQNKSRDLYNDILGVLIPALETGVIEGEGAFGTIPRTELRPRPIKSFEGRKFCGSLSGSSMYAAARHGFGNMVLMIPQRGQETPPDKYAQVWPEVHPAADAERQLLYPRGWRLRRTARPDVPGKHHARGDQELQPRQARHFRQREGVRAVREHDAALTRRD